MKREFTDGAPPAGKKPVIICGYPKSGNTWLTRLTAEILQCPAAGFLGQPENPEESIEGRARPSEYECYKAHHPWHLLEEYFGNADGEPPKIIYMYRDPRAIVVSASNYFTVIKYVRLHRLLAAVPMGLRFYYRFIHRSTHGYDVVARGLVNGTDAGSWLEEPWQCHVQGYLDRPEVCALSYESLREDPLPCVRKITEFLSFGCSERHLQEAIQEQSFEAKKRKFASEGRKAKEKFLRKGMVDGWKTELPRKHIRYIEENCHELMTRLGYKCVAR